MNSGRTGAIGEEAVCAYLSARGYRILVRNFRIRGGEADLIAADGENLCFVEVKARGAGSSGSGDEAVDAHKQEKLCRAAEEWCRMRHTAPEEQCIRFDIALVRMHGDTVLSIDYLEDAFAFS